MNSVAQVRSHDVYVSANGGHSCWIMSTKTRYAPTLELWVATKPQHGICSLSGHHVHREMGRGRVATANGRVWSSWRFGSGCRGGGDCSGIGSGG
jgi:hypothetical protein